MSATVHLKLVVRRKVFELHNLLFQLRREDVNAANDQHIVAAAADAVHTAHAARGCREQTRQVAGPVADHRQRLFGQRGEQQFTLLAVIQRRAVVRVDDLRVEMIFPDGRAVDGFDTLHRHARPHHFGEAIDVQGRNP